MSRDYNLYLQDILEAIERIQRYTEGMSFVDFSENDLVQDAVIRNLMVKQGKPSNESPCPEKKSIRRHHGERLQVFGISSSMHILAFILRSYGILSVLKLTSCRLPVKEMSE